MLLLNTSGLRRSHAPYEGLMLRQNQLQTQDIITNGYLFAFGGYSNLPHKEINRGSGLHK